MIYFAGLAIAVAFIAVAACGCGVGQGIAVYGATTSMARQPEMAGKIQLVMFIGLAFIESLTIYSLDDVLYSVGETAQDRGYP